MGKLERMTQFKEKSGKDAERASLGLFSYPVLMAADILIYKATHVPVGEDQKQHLELSRDIAASFNQRYGVEFFPQPEPFIQGAGTRVMSLQDGTKKIKKAQTDAEPLPSELAGLDGRAGARNLVSLYAALAEISQEDVVAQFAGQGWGVFKPALAELAVEKLAPITARMGELMNDPAEIDPSGAHVRKCTLRSGSRNIKLSPHFSLNFSIGGLSFYLRSDAALLRCEQFLWNCFAGLGRTFCEPRSRLCLWFGLISVVRFFLL